MNFDITKTIVSMEKWRGGEETLGLSFHLAPHDGDYLEIGENDILCASGYLPLRDKGRKPISATVFVTTDGARLRHIGGEKPICGFAEFFPERVNDTDALSALLAMSLVVEPRTFEEMLRTPLSPGAATLHLDIEGLKFGWEPDGSHQIWSLDDSSDCEVATRRRITGYRYSAETFWTSERSLQQAVQERSDAQLAESRDPAIRKLFSKTAPTEAGVQLLRNCRDLLLALLVLATALALRLLL